mmetsp:Transcript_122522/g.346478  ORF Transcript_122522/g.346478 Transcript_122522/m.346478 type:complete len:212 (+) Transcript_122522:285-920(+)
MWQRKLRAQCHACQPENSRGGSHPRARNTALGGAPETTRLRPARRGAASIRRAAARLSPGWSPYAWPTQRSPRRFLRRRSPTRRKSPRQATPAPRKSSSRRPDRTLASTRCQPPAANARVPRRALPCRHLTPPCALSRSSAGYVPRARRRYCYRRSTARTRPAVCARRNCRPRLAELDRSARLSKLLCRGASKHWPAPIYRRLRHHSDRTY